MLMQFLQNLHSTREAAQLSTTSSAKETLAAVVAVACHATDVRSPLFNPQALGHILTAGPGCTVPYCWVLQEYSR